MGDMKKLNKSATKLSKSVKKSKDILKEGGDPEDQNPKNKEKKADGEDEDDEEEEGGSDFFANGLNKMKDAGSNLKAL